MGYINPRLDHAAIRDALTRTRRALIRDFFEPPVVEALANALATVDWTLLYRDEGGDRRLTGDELRALSPERRMQLSAGINQLAARGYQFSFYSHPIVHTAQRGESDLLSRFVRWMADEEFLCVMRSLSGLQDIDRVYAQATMYTRGSFLNVHTDEVQVENRRLAYVINLTPRWRPDWGGLLHFDDGEGNVIETFFPHFNSLSLFLVPQHHFVSYVAPYAQAERLAITGWLIAS
jgi:Rps23 Pro-64 3,4-dihydroxylase Tpa1-like proline 4-hydroxylase